MTLRFLPLFMAGLLSVMACCEAPRSATAAAAEPMPKTLTIVRAWSRSTAPGATVGVAYFDVINPGAADVLLGIESPNAGRVEMHATTTVGGMMQMRSTESVAVPAGGHIRFAPGSLHAMLMELKRPLEEGQLVPLTLIFRDAGRMSVQAVVLGLGAMAPAVMPPAMMPSSPPAEYRLTAWPAHAATPDFALVDGTGRLRTLADYRGQVAVVFFGFVRCPDVCPAELFKLSVVMKRLGPAAAHVRVLFVTLDPARDTRTVLQHYVTAFDSSFVGLSGTPAQIERAAGNFYVEYARVGAGSEYTIDHSTSTFVLDAAGRLRLIGTPQTSIDDYAHDLPMLAAE